MMLGANQDCKMYLQTFFLTRQNHAKLGQNQEIPKVVHTQKMTGLDDEMRSIGYIWNMATLHEK